MKSQLKSRFVFNLIVILSMLLQSSAVMAATTIPLGSVSPAAQEQDSGQLTLITQYSARSEVRIGADWTAVDLVSGTPAEAGLAQRVLFKYSATSAQPAALEFRIHTGAQGLVASVPAQEVTSNSAANNVGEIASLAGAPAQGPWRLEARTTAGTAVMLSSVTLQVEQFVKGSPLQVVKGEAGTPALMRLSEGAARSVTPDVSEKTSGANPQAGPGTATTTIKVETFEGIFPVGLWALVDDDSNGAEHLWDDQSERSHTGSWAGWPAGGGANERTPAQGYVDNMRSWMIYGPFDLSDATSAQAVFYQNLITEAGFDVLFFGASGDGVNFNGFIWSGDSGGWVEQAIDFSGLAGDSSVWVTWAFFTDGSVTFEGPWVDDITVSKSDTPAPPSCDVGFSGSSGLSSDELMAAYQAAIDQASPAPVQDVQPYEILMESRRFVPDAGMEASVLDLAATGATGPTHMLLQFYNTPTSQQKEQLKAQGIELLHYIPTNAWIASVQPNALAALSSNASIRWGGMLTAQDRTSSLIADETLRAFYANKDKTLPLMVEFASDVSLDQAKEIVARFGGVVKSEVVSINSLLIYLPPNKFDALTRVDEIIWIEPPLPALEALNDCIRYRIGGDTLQAAPYDLNGSGVDMLVYDAGTVATTHSGFAGRLSVKDSSGLSDHATHVAGTAAGSGAGSSGNNLKGMAPSAQVLSYGFEGFAPGWLYTNPGDIEQDWNQAKNSFGADLGTASIGTNTAANGFPCEWEGNYGEVAQLLDAIVRGSLGEPYIATWAAGNERGNGRCGTGYGTTGPPSGAKNPIHVGATNSDTDQITSFSSFGPTDDGRIKPTISAPGCEQGGDGGINSALPPNTYGVFCGTSMATPAVAGLVSLMIQQYRATFGTTGEPRPSTVKAILIHTAVDKGNAGPDYQYGYGRVDGVAAVDTIIGRDFRQEPIAVTGEYHDYSYAHAGGPLKVSLAWDDAPATPSAAVQLVNDLDLTLISPSNQVFRPFILDPANPGLPATTGIDRLNNQEQIIVPDAASGTWKLRVRAQNLPVAPQMYSIVFKDSGTTTPTKVRTFNATVLDGWVLESTETSNVGGTMDGAAVTFNVGDAAGDKQFRAILSFSTAALPDSAVITSVTLRILRQSIVGTNPFTTHGNLLLDMKLGSFSGGAALQLTDFQAAANQNGIPIPNAPVAGWYSKRLPPIALNLINKTGVTQFRLRFARDDNDDLAADFIRFFSGNATAANRPQLIIQYHLP